MEDFQRITHHETDYSGTEGRRKRTIKKNITGGGCENVSLARHSETVPGSGDVSEGPVPLSVSPTNTTQHPQFEARVAADNCITAWQ